MNELLYVFIFIPLFLYLCLFAGCLVRARVMLRRVNEAWAQIRGLIVKKAALVEVASFRQARQKKARAVVFDRVNWKEYNKKLSDDMAVAVITLSQDRHVKQKRRLNDIVEQNTAIEEKIYFSETFFDSAVKKYNKFTGSLPYRCSAGLIFPRKVN